MEVIFFLYLILIFLSNLYIKKIIYQVIMGLYIKQKSMTLFRLQVVYIYFYLLKKFLNYLLNQRLILPLIGLFVLGLLSDLNIIFSSAKKRFFIQLLLISSYIFLSNLEVLPTRISLIDTLFSDTYLSLIFTIFVFDFNKWIKFY